MKKIIYILSIFCAVLTSCKKDIEPIEQQINLVGVNIKIKNGTLSFENKEQLDKVVENISLLTLASQPTDTNLKSINTLKENGFVSLYDIYVDAMDNAEYYYERPDGTGYDEFKKKYSQLYFPEEGDDYSAYLPISNKKLAKLADISGNIMINNEIVNVKDIDSYDQVVRLGMTPPNDTDNTITRAGTDFINKIPEQKVGKDKVWVNTSVDLVSITVEVCFRKKNFLGMWYNHNSGTKAGLITSKSIGYFNNTLVESFGFSSHDYIYRRVFQNGRPVMIYDKISITHNGTGLTFTLTVDFPRTW